MTCVFACVLAAAALVGFAGCQSAMRYDAAPGTISGEARAPDKAGPSAPDASGKGARELTAPSADPERGGMVIYNAVVHVVVERIAESLERVRSTAVAMGGYLQEMETDSVTVKVPVARFQEALAAVDKLGEVTHREIKGTDVSETMRDLAIRLKNAEEVRSRLVKMLDRAEKMDDALKIEKELERVTEGIELLKGKIRYLENGVAFSTLTVRLNSPVPQKAVAGALPFPWVERLATEVTQGARPEPGYWTRGGQGPAFDLPEGYVRYADEGGSVRAMSADGVLVRVERRDNCEGGKAEFWAKLIRRTLVERRALAVGDAATLKLKSGAEARLLVGSKEVGGKETGYLLAVAADRKSVYTVEAWGPREAFVADRAKIDKAIQSLRVRSW